MSNSELVLIERHGPIAVVIFNEPTRLNPFSDAMRKTAAATMSDLCADADVRAIVLHGAGGNFSAGADIRQMRGGGDADPALSRRRLKPLHDLVRLVATGPKPVVAAVEGAAFGAGLSLVAASDFAIASSTSRFGAAFAKVGLTADCGLLWSLPQRVGIVCAKDMMLTGRVVGADEALQLGLVDRTVGQGEALEAALAKASEYLAAAPLSIAAIRSGLAKGPMPLEEFLDLENEQQPMLTMTRDHQEGRTAFLEKRPPVFTGR